MAVGILLRGEYASISGMGASRCYHSGAIFPPPRSGLFLRVQLLEVFADHAGPDSVAIGVHVQLVGYENLRAWQTIRAEHGGGGVDVAEAGQGAAVGLDKPVSLAHALICDQRAGFPAMEM